MASIACQCNRGRVGQWTITRITYATCWGVRMPEQSHWKNGAFICFSKNTCAAQRKQAERRAGPLSRRSCWNSLRGWLPKATELRPAGAVRRGAATAARNPVRQPAAFGNRAVRWSRFWPEAPRVLCRRQMPPTSHLGALDSPFDPPSDALPRCQTRTAASGRVRHRV